MTSTLENSREQAATAASAAEQAQAAVTELDNRLETNANLNLQQRQALRNAEAEAARLKRSLKTAAKDKVRLTEARKKAAAKADKAKDKRTAAEAKYDKVVLAELVNREKERDRAQATDPGNTPAAKKITTAVGRTPAPDPEPERPDPATATATRTAARRTAARAR